MLRRGNTHNSSHDLYQRVQEPKNVGGPEGIGQELGSQFIRGIGLLRVEVPRDEHGARARGMLSRSCEQFDTASIGKGGIENKCLPTLFRASYRRVRLANGPRNGDLTVVSGEARERARVCGVVFND